MKRLLPLTFPLFFLAACSSTAPAEDPRPNVVIDTELGEIEVEVHLDTAPISGGDFLLYVDEGLYDGEGFYRTVRPDNDPRGMGMSLIQGGVLSVGTATDGYGEFATAPIAHERTTETGLSNTRGTLSIARLEPGTGSAGFFFINIGDNSFLDTGGTRNPDGEGYATFATVVRGMDVVEAIQAREAEGVSPSPATANQYLTDPVRIERAYRVGEEPRPPSQNRADLVSTLTTEGRVWRAESHTDWDFNAYPALRDARLTFEPLGRGVRVGTHDGCNGGAVIDSDGDPASVRFGPDGSLDQDYLVLATQMGCFDEQRYIGIDLPALFSEGAVWSLKGQNRLQIQTPDHTAVYVATNASAR